MTGYNLIENQLVRSVSIIHIRFFQLKNDKLWGVSEIEIEDDVVMLLQYMFLWSYRKDKWSF